MSLLVDGRLVPVPGATVIAPTEPGGRELAAGNRRPRPAGIWVRQFILHKTIADDPEDVRPGVGPPGAAARTAAYWDADAAHHSGAHGVTGHDGVALCLADLARTEAYHATVSNPWSVGWETCELAGGGCYQAAYDATIALALAACEALGIQLQIPKRAYNGHPLRRMLDGGRDVVGVLGHRDNTEARGKWDPGEVLFGRLVAAGAELMDFDAGEDLDVWAGRQRELAARGHQLAIDGVPGPATVAALRAEGYRGGVWALGQVTAA